MKNLRFSSFLRYSIPGTIWAIGISSLLINLSTSVIQNGTAVYLRSVLGVAVSTVGLVESIVEFIANSLKIFSGIISDYLRRRKLLMVIGFAFLTISKPLLAISKTVTGVLISRTIDRIGNGIQATPRDALVSDAAPKESKGACYGLRQSLSVVGSTLGGVFGYIVMKLSNDNFQLLFSLAAIPAAFATIILILFVRDKLNLGNKESKRKIRLKDAKLLGRRFWILMIVVAIFMSARFGEFYIALHASENLGMPKADIYWITIIFNLFTTIAAFPTGKLADSMNKVNLLFIGFLTLFAADMSIGYASSIFWIFMGTALWGIQRGMTEGIFAILVSDYVPKDLRGTGFGVYYIIVAVATFLATNLAGKIAQKGGEAGAFLSGSLICLVAILSLITLRKILSEPQDKVPNPQDQAA